MGVSSSRYSTATASGDSGLRIYLLGEFAVERDGQRLTGFSYAKGRALLGLLAAEAGLRHRREILADWFWPDLPTNVARTNLRQVVRNLRQVLEQGTETYLTGDHSFLGLEAERHWVDVAAFTANPAPHRGEPDLQRLADTAALYRGDFMAGLTLPKCPCFEEWLRIKREALLRRALALLEQLAQGYEQRGAYETALTFARRYTELDAWNEAGHRRLMRLYALTHRPAAALAQYESCCRILREELRLSPEPATQALADSLQRGELEADAATPAASIEARIVEKRQVSVVYARLTLLSPCDDVEASLELLRLPLEHCREIVKNHRGYCVPDPAGGILAYFGYPQAFEEAARWAVRAALALSAVVDGYLAIRTGVHTGAILIGAEPYLPDTVGATSARAVELAQLAGNGEVLISEDARRLVAAYFEGAAVAVQPTVHRVLRETAALYPSHFGATPFVGRKRPLTELQALWRRAVRGESCKLLIRGEPGIGKSRLLHALCRDIDATPATDAVHRILILHCFQEYRHVPFYPLIGLLENLLAFMPEESGRARLAKLETYCRDRLPDKAPQYVPLLAEWLSLPLAETYRPSSLAPAQQKAAVFAASIDLLRDLAVQQPLLLIIEDLHWLDHSTEEWLGSLFAWRPVIPMLALFSARPQFLPPWPVDVLPCWDLQPLEPAEAAAMAQAMKADLPTATLNWIVERADGVPLYVEEMVQMLPSHGGQFIPQTLQDLLAARLDGVGNAKRIAQLAATIGREFNYALLQEASPLAPAALQTALRALQHARLIESNNGENFQFKHALLCDAAYQSQPKALQQATHRRIAAELERRFISVTESRPEVLAQHWTLGGETPAALEYWLKAGQRAERRSANHEALDHYRAALRLICALPAGAERNRWEFIVQVRLGVVLFAVEGFGSVDAAAAFRNALPLCSELDYGIDAFRALWGLWVATMDSSFCEAELLAQKLLKLAEAGIDHYLRVQVHYVCGNNAFWLGKFPDSRRHLETALALYQPEQHALLTEQFGENTAVTSGTFLAWTLWLSGFPDQARRCSEDTLVMARRLDHPYSYCFALSCAAILWRWQGDREKVAALSTEVLQLARQHEFSLWQACGTMTLGWRIAIQGDSAGLEQLDAAVQAMRTAMGSAAVIFLATQVEAHLHFGKYDSALAAVEHALEAAEAKNERHFVAELRRLKGECLLGSAPSDVVAAEACFASALEISRRQAAKMLELRAAASLARLWTGQGREAEAVELLTQVYDWFEEGFDTPDLLKARRWLSNPSLIFEKPTPH